MGLVQSEAHRHLIEKELVLVVIWLKRNCWVGIRQQWLIHSCLVSYLHALSVSSYVLYLCWFYRSYSCHSFFVFLFSSLSQLILYARSCSLYPYVYNVTILCLLQYEIKDFERSVYQNVFSDDLNTLLKCILSFAHGWGKIVLAIRLWFTIYFCFTIMSYDGLVYFQICR